MGAFAAKLLRIPKHGRLNGEDDMSMSMPPMPPGGNMMQGGPQGFFPTGPMGTMNPMMGMMGPGISPDMMPMGNMGNIMMFGGVCQFCIRHLAFLHTQETLSLHYPERS